MTKPNQYVFDSEITGYVNVYKDSGKYENRTFSYWLPDDVKKRVEKDRVELLKWVDSKLENPGRVNLNLEPWDSDGLCKYSYSDTDKKPIPYFIDTEGSPLSDSDLMNLRKGTKVKLIVNQTPYTKPAKGTSLKVIGVQVIKLVTGNGASDSGDLSIDDVKEIFGQTSGYKASTPTVTKDSTGVLNETAEAAGTPCSVENYDF